MSKADDRCESVHGSLRCVGPADCAGPHWAPTGRNSGLRWGLVDFGCIVGMDVGLVCRKGHDHAGTHNDGRGNTWGDLEPIRGADQEACE